MIGFACPECRAPLILLPEHAACSGCGRDFPTISGVRRFLRVERIAPVAKFLGDYTRIRLAEGRGSDEPSFYRDLPGCPSTHPMAWQWRMHRRTWRVFRDKVLRQQAQHLKMLRPRGERLRILDLGAGTGWLSNRLASLGHDPVAVDLSCDDQDGLGAARHFAADWPRIQAEFDHLPLADSSVDMVVFNASLHYSADYAATLREALRVLAVGGGLVILETPVYQCDSSGMKMVAERRASFMLRYGTASDSWNSIQYLTWAGLANLGRDLGLEWRVLRPWYGYRWALRPFVAKIKGKREPSRFPILMATKVRDGFGESESQERLSIPTPTNDQGKPI